MREIKFIFQIRQRKKSFLTLFCLILVQTKFAFSDKILDLMAREWAKVMFILKDHLFQLGNLREKYRNESFQVIAFYKLHG